MKNILIIYPHWPPSNLVGTLRPRFISNYLPEFNWQPIVLTVNPKYYEEPEDLNLLKTVSEKVIVEYVDAKPIKRIRIIGDIGLRSYNNLKIKALQLIKKHDIDFVWISIPSFYTATLGRYLHKKTGVCFGIDYQDPWVRSIKNNLNLRSTLSLLMAKILEPFAVKNISLISGISKNYYAPVLEKYFKNKEILDVNMPVGFEPNDYNIKIEGYEMPWKDIANCKPIIYAGAFLPNSVYFLELLFKTIKKIINEDKWDKSIHLFFIGTGKRKKTITYYAKKYNITDYIHENTERIPYLQVIDLLKKAFGIAIIGSTEKHYTASKTYQSLLSEKPVFTIFHGESSAIEVMNECNAANYTVSFSENEDKIEFADKIEKTLLNFVNQKEKWQPNLTTLDKYSAKESAKKLIEAIEKVI